MNQTIQKVSDTEISIAVPTTYSLSQLKEKQAQAQAELDAYKAETDKQIAALTYNLNTVTDLINQAVNLGVKDDVAVTNPIDPSPVTISPVTP